jgi:predicted  nucleic acid-binding Zn-ribbon protein
MLIADGYFLECAVLADLERLVELQRLDSEIAEVEAAAAAIPGVIRRIEEQLMKAKAALDAVTAETDRMTKLRRQQERELEEVTDQLKKRQSRLFEIKTNQEYSAVLKEIEGLKHKVSVLEEAILVLLDQIEVELKARAEEEQRVRSSEAEALRDTQRKEAELRQLRGRLSELQGARKGRSKNVELSLLQQYLRLIKSRAGLAVAPARDGSCEGCHVALTPQLYNEVRRNEEILTCERCGRILYWRG